MSIQKCTNDKFTFLGVKVKKLGPISLAKAQPYTVFDGLISFEMLFQKP